MNKILIEGIPFTKETRANNEKPTLELESLIRNVYGGGYSHSQFFNVISGGFYKSMGYKYDLKPYVKRFLIETDGLGWKQFYFPDIEDLRKWHEETYEDDILEVIEPDNVVPEGCLVMAKFKSGAERFYQIDNPLSSSRSDTDWIFNRIEEKEDEKPVSVFTVVIEKLN